MRARRPKLRYALPIFAAAIVISFLTLDAFLRSYNEASDEDRAQGIRTKNDTYTSARAMGAFPLSLVPELKEWPDAFHDRFAVEQRVSV